MKKLIRDWMNRTIQKNEEGEAKWKGEGLAES